MKELQKRNRERIIEIISHTGLRIVFVPSSRSEMPPSVQGNKSCPEKGIASVTRPN